MLDHGILNVPGRVNGINAELDRFKLQQAHAAKAQAQQAAADRKAAKSKAKELFAQLASAMVETMAPGIALRQGLTAKAAAKEISRTLDQMVKWEPQRFIALAAKFQAEHEGAA